MFKLSIRIYIHITTFIDIVEIIGQIIEIMNISWQYPKRLNSMGLFNGSVNYKITPTQED